jgi:uncharacterized repeat protein (TIGR01451 family)
MKSRVTRNHQGQALVEFALVILVLMFIIFVLIEASRLFQANLTVQKAAREAGRYAITGQFETDCLLETPPCGDPRVESVRRVAEKGLAGLPLNPDADARMREPNAYLVEVMTPADDGSGWIEGVGDPGAAVLVRVLYEANMVTPLVRPIADVVRVTGQVVMNNERVTQVSGTSGDTIAPNLPPPPPPPPSPPPPDVGLSKSGPPRALTGSQFNYTLIVTNHSAEREATGVTLVDHLPSQVTLVAAPGCNAVGSVVTCHIGLLRPQTEQRFTITVEAKDYEGLITNNAEVAITEADPDLDNNRRAFDTILEADPVDTDVAIYKTGPEMVQGGESFAYSLIVANESLVPATGVTAIDTLPAGVTNVQAPGICAVAGLTVTCPVGNLDPLTDTEIVLYVTAPGTPGAIRNEATVTVSSPPDGELENNSTHWDTNVVLLPDLRVTLIDNPDPVYVGSPLTYEITVENIGVGTATNVILDDILPNTAEFVSATPAGCQRGGNVVSCGLGTMAPGAAANVTIVVRPAESLTIVNTATARSDETDRNAADNTASASTSVRAETDLSITKTGPTQIEQGTPFDYRLTVRNNGPSAATGVTVRDTLPSGVSVVSATTTQGYCDTNTHPVICSLGRMDNGAVATIIIRVIPITESALINRATVTGGENDPVPGNNATTWTTNVISGNHFMVASPLCGEVGTVISLQGYNWKKNQAVTLRWNNAVFATLPMTGGDDWSTTYTVPNPSPDGVYTIEARDSQGRVASVQFTIPCPAPNLIVVGQPVRVGTGVVLAGQPVTFRASIRNIGNLPAVSQFFVGLYANPNPEPVPATTHLPEQQRSAIVAVSGLEVGATKIVTFTLSAGVNAGLNRIYVVADSDPGPIGVILERRENDNISTPLELQVESSGSNPTPTPTATPVNPGSIAGRVRNEAGNPQANVGIWLYGPGNTEVAGTYSAFDGSYFFAAIAPGNYDMLACIRIEDATNPGIYRDYWASVPAVPVQSGLTTTQNLFLQLAPAGCPRP